MLNGKERDIVDDEIEDELEDEVQKMTFRTMVKNPLNNQHETKRTLRFILRMTTMYHLERM
jgi:hypothetical protein